MKTTIEIPDPLFRRAKSKAAERGQTLKDFFTQALVEKLDNHAKKSGPAQPAWMQGFGKLRHLSKETKRIEKIIAEEFETIEAEDRA
jgi:hypothetical protein